MTAKALCDSPADRVPMVPVASVGGQESALFFGRAQWPPNC